MGKDLVDNTSNSKTFDYNLKNTYLKFTLRIDNTIELVPYVVLLEKALADVKAEITRIQAARVSKTRKK